MSTGATAANQIATLQFYPLRSAFKRYFALWYFTTLITLWNVLGHTRFGFEQAWMHPFVGLVSAFAFQFLLEWVDALATGRTPRFLQSKAAFINFLPPAIIPGLAIPMLLYPGESFWPIVFAEAVAIGSKVLFRAPVGDGMTQHIFNPSNVAIVVTLFLFPAFVGLAPPYHFVENISGFWHWVLPCFILATGLFVHYYFTGRVTLVVVWLIAFVVQGQLRRMYAGTSWLPPLTPMTSAAFIVFTLYMIPDPATTPLKRSRQALFAVAVAVVYGILQMQHVVFGLFIALVVVCALRAVWLYLASAMQALVLEPPAPTEPVRGETPALAGSS